MISLAAGYLRSATVQTTHIYVRWNDRVGMSSQQAGRLPEAEAGWIMVLSPME